VVGSEATMPAPVQLLGPPIQLLGLDNEIDGFLLKSPNPSSTQVAEFLKLYASGGPRTDAARALIARGVDSKAVAGALTWLDASSKVNWGLVWGILSTASMAASAYHGYRRNQSIGWALWWALMGLTFPVITPVIGVAQGFGKRRVA